MFLNALEFIKHKTFTDFRSTIRTNTNQREQNLTFKYFREIKPNKILFFGKIKIIEIIKKFHHISFD